MTEVIIVLVTTNSKKESIIIAETLVKEKLVACVNMFPITSIYSWQEKICHEEEWQLIIKTNLAIFPQLEYRIKSLHSYEIPEIIAIPITQISDSYRQWMRENMISD